MADSKKHTIGESLTIEKFKALMDQLSNDLFLFVKGIVENDESSEEIVSDVFVKLWERRSGYPSIENIRSYLFILARNESISFLRKKKHIKILSLEEVEDYAFARLESDGTDFFDQEMIDRINVAIEMLPSKCKMAFSLAKVNGLKYKEIADIMDISPRTVKNHIAYALSKICAYVGISGKSGKLLEHDINLFFVVCRNHRDGKRRT